MWVGMAATLVAKDTNQTADAGLSGRRVVPAALALCKLLAAVSMLATFSAQAQTPACDQLKASLTARIKPGPTGFTLETVPAADPVPPGAKAIGTCEGSVYKILIRRGVNAENAQGAASAGLAPASAAAVNAPVVPTRPAMPEPTAPARSADLAAKPAQAPSPDAAARTALGASEPAAPAFMGPLPEPEKVALADTAPALPVQTPPVDEPTATGSTTQRAGAFVARHWLWILPLVLLPLLAWAAMWIAHRRAYDEAGLPRGPRL